jgi:hypothetical protein
LERANSCSIDPFGGCGKAGVGSIECVIVADEAVEPRDPVVEWPRDGIVLFGRPVEPGAAALAGDPSDGSDQPAAAAMAARASVDEQVLQIADVLHHPGMGMEEIMGDADKRRVGAAEARS